MDDYSLDIKMMCLYFYKQINPTAKWKCQMALNNGKSAQGQ